MNVYDLIKSTTKEAIFSAVLGIAKVAGFPTESWQKRNVSRKILEVFSEAISDLTNSVSGLAASAFRSTATGDWLELHAEDFYDITRAPATRATRTCVVTNNGASPVSWPIGSIVFRVAGTEIYFESTSNVALLNPGNSTTVYFRSTDFGTSQNSTELQVESSTGPSTSELASSVIVNEASDEESDEDLRTRCKEKWDLIAKATDDWYVSAAKGFDSEIKKVRVRRGYPNAGDVTLYIAGQAAPLPASHAVALENYLDPKPAHDGVAGWADNTYAVDATPYVVSVSADVYVRAEEIDAARTSALRALQDLAESTEIGGVVRRNDILRCIQQGYVINPKNKVVLSYPAVEEIALSDDQILSIATTSIGWFSV